MLMTFPCMTCSEDGRLDWSTTVHITHEFGARLTCSRGHVFGLLLQEGGYPYVYERALQRLAGGMLRDAVLDAYTAFDMYLSHVPPRARYDREKGASPKALRRELKFAIGMSERALGAAIAVASLVSGRAFSASKVLGEMQRIRNEAVHAGVSPSEKDAEQVCLGTGEAIKELEDMLKVGGCVNGHHYFHELFLEERQKFIDDFTKQGIPVSTVGISSSVAHPYIGIEDPKARLDDYRAGVRRTWLA